MSRSLNYIRFSTLLNKINKEAGEVRNDEGKKIDIKELMLYILSEEDFTFYSDDKDFIRLFITTKYFRRIIKVLADRVNIPYSKVSKVVKGIRSKFLILLDIG